MKKVYTASLVILALLFLSFNSKCKKCEIKSEKQKTIVFLTEMTDARLMDREEGREAAKKGTTVEIRNYGELMVKDQTYLLEQLHLFAKTRNIKLPKQIADEKQKALDKLKEKIGKDFDQKFLKMICIDHKRDVRKFTKATKSKDAEVSNFAVKHLPMIESHLQKVEKIKSEQ